MIVSIIVPVFNGERFLAAAIESCLTQTYDDITVMIVDDGSTDNTRRIVEDYKKSDPRVQYVFQENAGLVEARKTGVRNISSPFFVFLDADDVLERDAVESLVTEQKKGDYDIVFSNFFLENESGKEFNRQIGNYKYGLSKTGMINNIFTKLVDPPIWGRLIRREVFLLSNVPPEMTIGEDAIAWFQILASSADLKISKIDNRVVHYIQRGGSMVNVKSDKKNHQRLLFLEWVARFFDEEYDYEYDKDALSVFLSSDLYTYLRDGGDPGASRSLYELHFYPYRKTVRAYLKTQEYLLIQWTYQCPVIGRLYRLALNKVREIVRSL